mgnify:CR=1 FL=1
MVYNNNRDLKKINSSRLQKILSVSNAMLVLSLLVLGAVAFPLLKSYSREQVADQEIKEIERQIKESEEKNMALKEMLAYLDSDQAVEDKARLSLNYKKEGELVVVIQDQTGAQGLPYGASAPADISNPVKWFHYFFN